MYDEIRKGRPQPTIHVDIKARYVYLTPSEDIKEEIERSQLDALAQVTASQMSSYIADKIDEAIFGPKPEESRMEDLNEFFLVWNCTQEALIKNIGAGVFRTETRTDACEVARKKAKDSPNDGFFVLKATDFFEATNPVRHEVLYARDETDNQCIQTGAGKDEAQRTRKDFEKPTYPRYPTDPPGRY